MTNRHLGEVYEILDEFRKVSPFAGIQTAQCFVYIAMHEPCPMKDLADALGFAQSTVSRNVGELTKMNRWKKPGLDLVRADADPMEMRRKICRLTPKGRKLMGDLIRRVERYHESHSA